MQLTEHFTDTELGVAGCAPNLVASAIFLCRTLLEPIRSKFGPLIVHDGYRDPTHNAEVGGKPTSWHQFDGNHSAADFHCANAGLQTVFDWIRLESALPFDKVILEHAPDGNSRCVHIQVDSLVRPRREAYIGSTGAGTVYTPVEVK